MKTHSGARERECVVRYAESEAEAALIARDLHKQGYAVEVLPCNWSGLWMAVGEKVTPVAASKG